MVEGHHSVSNYNKGHTLGRLRTTATACVYLTIGKESHLNQGHHRCLMAQWRSLNEVQASGRNRHNWMWIPGNACVQRAANTTHMNQDLMNEYN